MAINFLTLGISSELEGILKKNGIVEPTPIQEQAIPQLLKGKDIIAQAHTGTGKTLAFMLPMMERIDTKQSFIQGLIITPTRELAIQITNEAKKLASVKGVNILAAYGGQDVDKQIKKLNRGIHLVIATPGRLLDHIRRKTIDLSQLKMIVLDEADEMLRMGFFEDIENIIHEIPWKRQTMLFSATIPQEVRSLATRYTKDPYQIQIQGSNITLDEIKQIVVETTDRGKQDALCKAIDEYRPFLAIIFCRTKRRVSALNEDLQARGYDSDELHGDLSQAKREKVMKSFRKAEIQLLVATDVAARGLDVEGMTHVFNYDIPEDAEGYIHRIGRTGRGGHTGIAVTFVTPKDKDALAMIERKIKMTLKKQKIEKEKDKRSTNKNKNYKEQREPKRQRFKKEKDSKFKKTSKNNKTRQKKR
ncbi:DEAD/DEAH box helicase [Tissierella sp. MSJ-40]|uniref:RNA helicase n=1 Tax=Tissierella simiarum TaxID=2841534 RepID=A0ABS6E5C5_9FIRM|nr:DEAD/DEAH box helicase [Tissierella simiarum]MBU5438122.1 DEAD/DEAH box helicase [Tissierella simiarum]